MRFYFSYQQQRDAEDLKNSFDTGACPRCALELTYPDYDTPFCADYGFPEHDFSGN